MTPISLMLALLLACGGDPQPAAEEPADGVADAEEPAAEEPSGPPEGFTCPEGTELKQGKASELEGLWHAPTLPHPKAGPPMQAPDAGFEEVSIAPEPGESVITACVGGDGMRTGAYHVALADGAGTISGQFAAGVPTGEWIGLWTVEEEPAEAAPEPDAADEGGEGTEGEAEAPEEEPKEPQANIPELETEAGTALMFRGSYAEDGTRVGKWFQGCEPGCDLQLQMRGLFDEEGKIHGRWQWHGEGEVLTQYVSHGDLTGKYVHVVGDETTSGSFARGERKGRWVWKKAGEVVKTEEMGGQVRRLKGKDRRE